MLNLRTLGPVSSNLISHLYELGKTIFTLADIREITRLQNNAARDLASKLIKRNVITRIKPGKFLIIPQEISPGTCYIGDWYVVAREIVKSPDYYISYYSAMDIHNMLTQSIMKVFVTTPAQEYRKEKRVGNTTFEFIYTGKKNIWGVKNYWITRTEQVRVSDLERTIIDCLYRPQYCGGILEVAKGIWIQKEKIDYDKLFDYAQRFKKMVVVKRLGYTVESLGLQNPAYLKKLRAAINNKYYTLDPLLTTEETHRNSWRLIANISPEEMRKAVSV